MALKFGKKVLPTIICPRCGSPATYIEAKPHCGACGWNVDRIRHYLTKSMAQAVFAVASAVALWSLYSMTWWMMAFMVAFVLFGSLAGIVRGFLAIRTVSPSAPRPPNLDLPFTQVTPVSLTTLDWKKGIAVRLAATAAIFLGWFVSVRPFLLPFLHKLRHPASLSGFEWALVLLHALLLALAVHSWHRALLTLRSELRLADLAAMATGRIVKQEFRLTGGSEITYEFRDPSGAIRRGVADDPTHLLFEEMAIPIAYRWDDPGTNLPLAAFAVYRIKQPSQAATDD